MDSNLPPEAELQLAVFKKSLPMQVKLQEILRVLGSTDGLDCLELGADNAMMSYQLRKNGGRWHSVVSEESLESAVQAVVGDGVHVLGDGALPFENKIFDVVVVIDVLERLGSDADFIEECHRLLRPDGRLVVIASLCKSWTIINGLRAMLGVGPDRRGLVRAGYSDEEMFGLMKHGFDVLHLRSFLRFYAELVSTFADAGLRDTPRSAAGLERVRRVFSWCYPLWRAAYQLDMLLLLTRGFSMIVTCKRHIWLPRNAPVLVDGRSISEAVLSKAGR